MSKRVLRGQAATDEGKKYRPVGENDLALGGVEGHMLALLVVAQMPQSESANVGFAIHQAEGQPPVLCLRFAPEGAEPLPLALGPGEVGWVRSMAAHGCFGVTTDPGREGADIQPFWYAISPTQQEAIALFLARLQEWTLEQAVGMLLREEAGPSGAVLQ